MRKCIYTVNVNFFKQWNPKMAYILGLVFSDGNISKYTLSWELRKVDKELLFKVRNTMSSDHPIRFYKRWNSVGLKIFSKKIVEDLKLLGFASGKKFKFPQVPQKFLKHFIRGFLDGDGWIIASKGRREISVGFTSGNKKFLEKLIERLNNQVILKRNRLRTERKRTKSGKLSVWHQIEWYGKTRLTF